MISLIKNSAAAFAAWHVSSFVTVFQMAWFKAVLPETYNWVIGTAELVVVPAWQLICQGFRIAWEFLNSPF